MEFVYHLGLAHLTLEPVVIAYYNWLHSELPNSQNQLILKMLAPHMERTLAINNLAKHTLIAHKDALTNGAFSTGKKRSIDLDNLYIFLLHTCDSKRVFIRLGSPSRFQKNSCSKHFSCSTDIIRVISPHKTNSNKFSAERLCDMYSDFCVKNAVFLVCLFFNAQPL